jgi:hypothetical protein
MVVLAAGLGAGKGDGKLGMRQQARHRSVTFLKS